MSRFSFNMPNYKDSYLIPCALQNYLRKDRTKLYHSECKIIFQHWVAYERNASPVLAEKERLTCPLLWCRENFDDLGSCLRHLSHCARLSDSWYWCPFCHRAESFEARDIPRLENSKRPGKKLSKLKMFLSKHLGRRCCGRETDSVQIPPDGGSAAVTNELDPDSVPYEKDSNSFGGHRAELDSSYFDVNRHHAELGSTYRRLQLGGNPIAELSAPSQRVVSAHANVTSPEFINHDNPASSPLRQDNLSYTVLPPRQDPVNPFIGSHSAEQGAMFSSLSTMAPPYDAGSRIESRLQGFSPLQQSSFPLRTFPNEPGPVNSVANNRIPELGGSFRPLLNTVPAYDARPRPDDHIEGRDFAIEGFGHPPGLDPAVPVGDRPPGSFSVAQAPLSPDLESLVTSALNEIDTRPIPWHNDPMSLVVDNVPANLPGPQTHQNLLKSPTGSHFDQLVAPMDQQYSHGGTPISASTDRSVRSYGSCSTAPTPVTSVYDWTSPSSVGIAASASGNSPSTSSVYELPSPVPSSFVQSPATDGKTLRCPKCNATSSELSNLKRHLRLHGLRTKLRCPMPTCDSDFTRKDNVDKHLREIHGSAPREFKRKQKRKK